MTDTQLQHAAHDLLEHGIRTIPIKADGSKVPALRGWPSIETSRNDIDQWFGAEDRHTAMGILTGTTSGNLEMTEIEGEYAELVPDLTELARQTGNLDLWQRISVGWMERSPSGGLHWFYRVTDGEVTGNTKLARDDRRETENGGTEVPTIAETRGTGGYVVAAPTGGHAHSSGLPWVRLTGGPATIAEVTRDERDRFTGLFRMLDQQPATAAAQEKPRPARDPRDGATPADDFENKTSWTDILTPHGWSLYFVRGNTHYWTRPGRTGTISATTGHAEDRDRLFVFSSSTEFESEVPYTKFGAYTLLNHDGDHSAASGQLRKDGYGQESRPHFDTTTGSGLAGLDARMAAAATPASAEQPAAESAPTQPAPAPTQPAPAPEPVPDEYGLSMTDDANAHRLLELHGERLRYHVDKTKWLVWNGTVWETQSSIGGRARELAKDAARRLPERGADDPQKLQKHKRYSLSDRGLNAMLNMARTDPNVMVGTDDLDQHAWEMNTPGGIVNLRTGEMTPSDPAKLHSRITSCAPDPDADQSLWLKFLSDTFPDAEVRDYIQRLAGYSAIGEVREHILPFAYGSGRNGKGVFLETLKAIFGSYAGKAPGDFLMKSQNEQHPTSMADLAGRRLVITSEVDPKDKFDERKVKELTGGDTVSARHMRQDFFEFEPTHHLWLMANHQPAVESGGEAFWDRIRQIPFDNKVPEEEQDKDLKRKLSEEHAPSVLAWVIEGAVRYAEQGLLGEPAAVKAATEDYMGSSDAVGQFLEECCYYGEGFENLTTTVQTLRAAYAKWCGENGTSALGDRRLTQQLKDHGIRAGREMAKGSGGARLYGGVAVKAEAIEDGREDTASAAAGEASVRELFGE